ncbi:hypothetical protein BJ944DRAFT_265422 [Cunninghamella echinulata]|nr:hypothetical protein BJ944DRAFT_265422 [Cunninghamella echinulata]
METLQRTNDHHQNNNDTTMNISEQERLREEIAKLKREWEELCEKDNAVKQNILAVREQLSKEK